MKTFADIKKRCTLGTILEITYHYLDHTQTIVRGNTGTTTMATPKMAGRQRAICTVQTNAIAFRNADGRQSWLRWPPAKDVRIDGPDAFSIMLDGDVEMSYRFV